MYIIFGSDLWSFSGVIFHEPMLLSLLLSAVVVSPLFLKSIDKAKAQ
jgi:hypothetical protein